MHLRIRLLKSAATVVLFLVLACADSAVDSHRQSPLPAQSSRDAESSEPICHVSMPPVPMATSVRETSGLAVSVRHPDALWTHNDSGHAPDLFAIGPDGRSLGTVRLQNVQPVDWEDLDVGPCPDDSSSACLYIADIGDNLEARSTVSIHVVPEPSFDARTVPPPRSYLMRYPDGPRDAEGLFVTGDGTVYVVSKGGAGDAALYRYPPPLTAGSVRTLERVRVLLPGPIPLFDRITAATTTPDGRWVAVRSPRMLYIYAAASLVTGDHANPITVDLSSLGELQGEGLAMSNDGIVWLSSEAVRPVSGPTLTELACRLPGSETAGAGPR